MLQAAVAASWVARTVMGPAKLPTIISHYTMKSYNLRPYLIMATVAMSLFICSFPIRHVSFYDAAYAESICFFGVAWYFASKSSQQGTSLIGIVVALSLGRFLLEIPGRLTYIIWGQFELYHLMPMTSMLIPFITASTVSLAVLCWHEKRPATYVLSTIIILLLCSVAHQLWLTNMLEIRHGMY